MPYQRSHRSIGPPMAGSVTAVLPQYHGTCRYVFILCYEHAMIWNVPAMIWATYLCIYVYEAPGVQPSRLGSKKAWDWLSQTGGWAPR